MKKLEIGFCNHGWLFFMERYLGHLYQKEKNDKLDRIMKRIDIIYGHSLKGIEGINYVNNSFVEGGKYFHNNNLTLSRIYSPYESFDCINQNKLTLIGSNFNLSSYKRNRRYRMFLKRLFSSDYYLGALIKLYFNYIFPAKRTICKYLKADNNNEYIIFQCIFSAYWFFKYNKKIGKKTILILHCSQDPFEQMKPNFKGLFSHTWFNKLIYSRLNYVYQNIDKIVYLSKRATDCSTAPKEKIVYIFNGEEDLVDWELTDVHEPLNLVCVGSMIWRKGQDLVIEALTKLSEEKREKVRLHLIGDGPQMAELNESVNDNNLQNVVIFYGARNDVSSLLKGMDVFIMPSESEGLPMSIIEALRQGMYIMSTDTGAIPEMIKGEFGEIIDRNPNNIAKSIENLIDNKIINNETKKLARKHYLKHFTLRTMINGYSNLLNSL